MKFMAILNLHAAPMPSTKFPLHQEQITIEDLQDGRRCCLKIFKMADNFSNSESLCRSNASCQVLAQSDLWFGRCRLKDFKMATMVAILDF